MPEKGIKGPVTVVSGKRRRVTIVEVGPSMPEMIDVAKVVDLAILAIDCTKGLEMEQFEYLNMLQVCASPFLLPEHHSCALLPRLSLSLSLTLAASCILCVHRHTSLYARKQAQLRPGLIGYGMIHVAGTWHAACHGCTHLHG